MVYRVAQEALTNVARHGGARRAWVALARDRRCRRAGGARRRRGLRSRRSWRGRWACAACASARCWSAPSSTIESRPAEGTTRPAATRSATEVTAAHHRRGCCSPTTTRWSGAGCGWCSTPSPTCASWPRPATGRRRSRSRARAELDLAVLDVSMPRMTGLQAAAELRGVAPGAARADAVDARQRAVPVRGAEGGRVGLRAQVGRRPRPGRGVPRGVARRAVPVPVGDRGVDPRLPRPRARRGGGARRSADAARAAGRQADRRGAHERADRRSCCRSAARRSSATART